MRRRERPEKKRMKEKEKRNWRDSGNKYLKKEENRNKRELESKWNKRRTE